MLKNERYEFHDLLNVNPGIVLELAKAMHEESDFSDEPLEMSYLYRLFNHQDVFAKAIYDKKSEKYVGGLIGSVSKAFFGPVIRASDFVFFIKQESRGSAAAAFLLKEFEDWAIKKGAKKIYMGSTTGINVEAYCKFLFKFGYKDIGFIAKKEV